MAYGLTDKQEQFARGLFKGLNQVDAYLEAYPASKEWNKSAVYPKASALAKHGKVQARLTVLRAPVERAMQYGVQEAMEEALQAFKVGMDTDNASGMVAAATLRAKLQGLLIEKREVKVTSLDHFDPSDKTLMIEALTRELALRKVLPAPAEVTDIEPKTDAT